MNKFKKLLAVISAASILFSLAACTKNDPENNPSTSAVSSTQTKITKEYTTAAITTTEAAETSTQAETTTQAPSTTEPTTEETTTKPTTTQKPTTTIKPTTTKKATTTKKKTTTTKKSTTTKKKVTAPTQKADIVKLYNSAASAASSAKPGYKKSVNTVLSNLNMGALAKIGAVRDTVGNFMGEGSSSTTVSKGTFDGKSLVKSGLKDSDVTAATCKLSSDGKYYELTLTVKNETNPLKGSSALGRFTKDYKDVDEIKSGLSEAGASVESLTVSTTSVTITAKINASNNRFVSLKHSIKMSATLNNVKYSIAKVNKATADLETTVNYTDFKY